MRVTIVVEDKTVTVDGMTAYLGDFDWSPFADVHAVQANLERDRAEVEFASIDPDGDGPLPAYKPANEIISRQAFAERFALIMDAYMAAPKGRIAPNIPGAQAAAQSAQPSEDVDALKARIADLERMVSAHNEAFQQLDKIAGDGQ